MIIDNDLCIQCEACIEYCPVNAIEIENNETRIDQDLCT
jgi:ferredoxin